MSINMDTTNAFIQAKVESGEDVAIYLANGIKLQGSITGFDDAALVVTDPKHNREQLVHRHAISTIA